MVGEPVARVALLWRGDLDARRAATPENNRLRPVFDAFAELDVIAEPAVYAEELSDEVRKQLLDVDGVVVWVDPLSGGRDREDLDALLREVSAAGVWVSTHPDVILKMGVKEVLVHTRSVGWGNDVHLYDTAAA